MTWRVAKSLLVLREQINEAFPGRSKASDGTIGDARHQSSNSDHNPWVKDGAMGVVTALDITNDPAHGVHSRKLAEALVASQDPRIKYLISDGEICSGLGQKHPAWKWRPYSGSNQHRHHFHVSVQSTKALYDDEAAWNFRRDRYYVESERVVVFNIMDGQTGKKLETLQTRPVADAICKKLNDETAAGAANKETGNG